MLPRPKRLVRATFGTVAGGKRAISAHFSVSSLKTVDGKAGAVVAKKVAKKSVDRHLLKRRILSVIEPLITPGRSFVVYARAGSPELSFPVLKQELTELLTTLYKV